MKKLLCVAAVAAMCVPAMGATLELSIQVTPTEAALNQPVLVEIVGEVVGASDGLALWSTNVLGGGFDLCTPRFLDAPAGDMESFKRNLGLTNPGPGGAGDTTGYAGTCSGAGDLWQVGGGLNTINNTGPTLYPIEDVIPIDVAVGGPVVLASGSFNFPGSDVTLTLDSAFANVIVDGSTGPVYPVEEADVSLVTASATVTSGGVPPVLTEVWSFGYHAGSIAADLGLPVITGGGTDSIYEPRERQTADGKLYIEVTMDQAMSTGAVSANPAITGVTATADGSAVMLIEFPGSLPNDDTCYTFDLSGSQGTGGAVAGETFCLCYALGDANRGGVVEALDNSAIGANFFANADNEVRTGADINRSGVVEALDNSAVGANFFQQPTPCP